MIGLDEIIVRLLVTLALSGLIGLQRYLAGKAAGIRTHALVGMGAAVFTLVSAYSFKTSTPDRVAAQIVSGIGFIGGGAILKERGSIKGLTTAAGLWASAAVGMAAGAGSYRIAVPACAIMLVTLAVMGVLERRLPHGIGDIWTVSITANPAVPLNGLREVLTPHCHKLMLERLEIAGELHLLFYVDFIRRPELTDLTAHLRTAGAESVVWQRTGNVEMETGP